MNKTTTTLLLGASALITLTACSSNKTVQQGDMQITKIEKNQEMDEEYLYLGEKESQLIEHNNEFAVRLYQKTAALGNHIISPLSVTYLMSMLADGADGQTRSEMLNTLGWDEATMEDVDALCQMLIDKSGKLDHSTKLNIANYIATNSGTILKKDFVTGVEKNYRAGVHSLDFSRPQSTKAVNDWCKEQTDGMIPIIVDQLEPSMSLIAMNAIFFNGAWSDKFNKSQTKEETFTGITRDIKKVQMMHQNNKFDYMDNDTLQAVSLPYGNGSYEMTVLLPRQGKSIDEMMQSISADRLTSLRYQMEQCKVDLKLPRFTTEQRTSLNEVISALGAPSMFTPAANFSRMSSASLFVSQMFQKAKIEVSEEGTKAAAVTAAIMVTSCLHETEPRHVQFHANRPFVYFITQRATGAILFMGQYVGD